MSYCEVAIREWYSVKNLRKLGLPDPLICLIAQYANTGVVIGTKWGCVEAQKGDYLLSAGELCSLVNGYSCQGDGFEETEDGLWICYPRPVFRWISDYSIPVRALSEVIFVCREDDPYRENILEQYKGIK